MQDSLAEQIDFMIEPSSNFDRCWPPAASSRSPSPGGAAEITPDIPTAMRPACPAFFARCGTGCGCRRAPEGDRCQTQRGDDAGAGPIPRSRRDSRNLAHFESRKLAQQSPEALRACRNRRRKRLDADHEGRRASKLSEFLSGLHCELSCEAIHPAAKERMDCFRRVAPRNDGRYTKSYSSFCRQRVTLDLRRHLGVRKAGSPVG